MYEYQCDACGERFETIRKFSDPPLDICEKCGKGPVQRLVSSPAFQFKGSGWYITDYAKKGGSTDGSANEGSTKDSPDSAKSGTARSDTAKSDTAKSDTASADKSESKRTESKTPAKPAAPSTSKD
jgi:putative FmdB family regulatory protein